MRTGLWSALVLVIAMSGCHSRQPVSLTISVAASLTDAMKEVEAGYARRHPGVDVKNNFGGSGALAQQIEDGAPVDVLLSAAAKPMDDLAAREMLVSGTRQDVLRNELVLIAPVGSKLASFDELAGASVRTIAVGDPGSVPAGRYAEQTLNYLHLAAKVGSKLVLAKDVRQVLAYVETGNADGGLVYATDAAASAKVRVVATAPEAAHDPIVYPIAAIRPAAQEREAREFVEYVAGPEAGAVFRKYGFTTVAK